MSTTSSIRDARLDLAEAQLRVLIKEAGYDVVITALHNACVHGEIFEEGDHHDEISEKDLSDMFDHYDALIKIAKQFVYP